jgi:hypothetical protein
MNISGVVTKFQKERKKLLRDLARVDGVLTALGHSARDAFEKGRKKYAHSAKARQAISRAQKRRWAKVKAAKS